MPRRYCAELNLLSASGVGVQSHQGAHSKAPTKARIAIDAPRKGGNMRRRSSEPYVLAKSGGSTAPDLPPMLHYNCEKRYFVQELDHFAGEAAATICSFRGAKYSVYLVTQRSKHAVLYSFGSSEFRPSCILRLVKLVLAARRICIPLSLVAVVLRKLADCLPQRLAAPCN